MSLHTTPLAALCAASAALLLTAAPSFAAVSESRITIPSGPQFLVDEDAVDDAPFPVSGTSDGTTGDVVDIVCSRNDSRSTVADDVPVAADGTFSTTVDPDAGAFSGRPCFLRAVRDNPSANANFRGPVIAILKVSRETVSGGPNDATVTGWNVQMPGLQGGTEFNARGINDLRHYGPSLNDENDPVAGHGVLKLVADTAENTRPALLVDGAPAYTGQLAADLFGGADQVPGLPASTIAVTPLPGGGWTITSREPLVGCTGSAFPPTAIDCPTFVPIGVTFQRTYRTTAEADAVEITERFTSTDGAAHAVDLTLESRYDNSENGWLLPGADLVESYRGENRLDEADLPNGPFRLYAQEVDDEPGGSREEGTAGYSWDTRPRSIIWDSENDIDVRHVLSVPAGGSASVRSAAAAEFTIPRASVTLARVDDGWSGPQLTIGTPGAGQTVFPGTVRVTGTTDDVQTDPRVAVNGVAARVEPDGFWWADVPAPFGPLTLTATATDGAGLTASAVRSVTVAGVTGPAGTPGPAGAVAPASVAATSPLRTLTRTLRARKGGVATLRVDSRRRGTLRVVVTRRGRVVQRVTRRVTRAGTLSVPLRAPRTAGSYAVRVTLNGIDGSDAQTSATLRVS